MPLNIEITFKLALWLHMNHVIHVDYSHCIHSTVRNAALRNV